MKALSKLREIVANIASLPEIRNKLLITGFILLVYQFAAHVPVIGVDREALSQLLNGGGQGANLIQILNLLSGGAVTNFSILANGVYPYITASIIFQLLTPMIPQLEAIQREPGGREKIQQYTYWLAIPMALLQSVAQVNLFNALIGRPIIPGFGTDWLLTASVMATMTAGTMFAIWLGELITEQGIGNGVSIIIFGGIVATAPANLVRLWTNSAYPLAQLVLFVVLVAFSLIAIIYIHEGVRKIPVNYGRRVRGNKQYGGGGSHIPLKVNPVGMIPLILAQSIITLPAVFVSLFPPGPVGDAIRNTFGNQQGFWYWIIFFVMVVGLTFVYTDVQIGNQNLADNLQRQGGFIPGIRPGANTDSYIRTVTRRITLVGALFLGIIAITPGIVDVINALIFQTAATTGVAGNAAYVLSGSGLIIVVGVVIDTMRQLEAQLMMRNYEGFMN
jgi:preprotein translocase subunit SecY